MQLDKMNTDKGFTLIEMAVVLTISALLITMGFNAVKNAQGNLARTTTHKTMGMIQDALSAYVIRNNRLPCPSTSIQASDDFGWELNSTEGTAIGRCDATVSESEGIIPFLALGLQKDEIKDGWGNLITYRVSTAFTIDPEDDTTLVHGLCRTDDWVEAGRNMNALKARFCCSGNDVGNTTEDVKICRVATANCDYDTNPENRLFPFNRDDTTDPLLYGTGNDINLPALPDLPAAVGLNDIFTPVGTENIKTMVYYLLSHGENGYGAFDLNGTRDVSDPDVGTYEVNNAITSDERVWVLDVNDVEGASHYDDIVTWATQDDVYARLGRETCLLP